jgi:hypothetical protein
MNSALKWLLNVRIKLKIGDLNKFYYFFCQIKKDKHNEIKSIH